MVTEIELFETPDIIPLDFVFGGRMKGKVYKIKANARYELLARILDAAARMKKMKINSRDLRPRVAKCNEIDDMNY